MNYHKLKEILKPLINNYKKFINNNVIINI